MKKVWSLSLLVLLAGVTALAEREVEETCLVGPAPSVYVSNVSGTISVESWDKNEVYVHARLGDRVKRLDFRCSEGKVHIEVVAPKHSSRGIKSYLTVRVPPGTNLDADAVSASISVSGVAGRLELGAVSGDVKERGDAREMEVECVSGDITIEGGAEEIKLETVSGDIRLTGNAEEVEVSAVSGDVVLAGNYGSCTVETTSGSIRVTGSIGDLDVETISGGVKVGRVMQQAELSSVSGGLAVTGELLSELEMGAVSGRIAYGGGLAERASVKLETNSGSVNLVLSEATRANLEIETRSGSIRSDIGGEARRQHEHGPGRELVYKVSPDAPTIDIETGSGSVTILRGD